MRRKETQAKKGSQKKQTKRQHKKMAECARDRIGNLDSQQAKYLAIAIYAEYCRSSFFTAQILTRHASTENENTLPKYGTIIEAMRREAAHPRGAIQEMMPLLCFIFQYHRLPQHQLVPRSTLQRIMEHYDKARQLVQSSTKDELGEALFACLTTGFPLSSAASVSTTSPPVFESPSGQERDEEAGRSAGADEQSGTAEQSEEEADKQSESECVCPICESVQSTNNYWQSYEPTDEIRQYLRKHCLEMEERLRPILNQTIVNTPIPR